MIAQFAKSKTMIFAVLLAVLGVLQASMDVFTAYLTPQGVGIATMIVSMVVAVLRILTTTSLGEK
jgi:hypothetical protein